MTKKVIWPALVIVAILTVAMVVLIGGNEGRVASDATRLSDASRSTVAAPRGGNLPSAREGDDGEDELAGEESGDADPEETEEPQTEEEKREAEEAKLVDAFDDLTDTWLEPTGKGVTMGDIEKFAKTFRQVPKARQDECVHRALNLIPDENVMILAGILMDKSMDREIIETVYGDILNRDENVKKPILQQIFKDKSHPCWADTAWILDVTGELPSGN